MGVQLVSLRGLQKDVYCQIGLMMLVGISSNNDILMVARKVSNTSASNLRCAHPMLCWCSPTLESSIQRVRR